LTAFAGGRRLTLDTAHGLFAADRIDDGTELLLAHLPRSEPRAVLDLGCGYGALGLSVAAAYPDADVRLVDRDLLAVAYASHNAARNELRNVRVEGGLDYRHLEPTARFDWILCNVPARIGARAIAHLLGAGLRRLRSRGQLRTVAIRDLGDVVAAAAAEQGLSLVEVARGRRHVVHACTASDPVDRGTAAMDGETDPTRDDLGVYARDEVVVEGRRLVRPHDLGEDKPHLEVGVPLLLDLLPRRPVGRRCVVVRPWYGAVPIALAARGAQVAAIDRDLLALLATRSNAARHGVTVGTRAGPWLPDVIGAAVGGPPRPAGTARHGLRMRGPRAPAETAAADATLDDPALDEGAFRDAMAGNARSGDATHGDCADGVDLVVGELSASSGDEAARRELTATRRWLAPGGEALWLLGERLAAAVVRGLDEARVPPPREIARRAGFVVLRDVARTSR
jgi:ribosomal protein L11 methylase PrmA